MDRKSLPVTRVSIFAPICSFRYPYFVTGHQPTFNFPPPSTIYGLCACACGKWPSVDDFFFGIIFSYKAIGQDLEHQHISSSLGPKTKLKIWDSEEQLKATTEIIVQPVTRDFIFSANLVLYLPPSFYTAFNQPVNAITLGRSQDLAQILEVKEIELVHPNRARIEHTILPGSLMFQIKRGSMVLLTRFISEPPERIADFEKYMIIHDPLFYDEKNLDESSLFNPPKDISSDSFWSDPEFLDEEGYTRGMWLHKLK